MSEVRGINFRVANWIIGQTVKDDTIVLLQGLGHNEEELYDTEKAIFDFCKSQDVKCERAKGPKYEQSLK